MTSTSNYTALTFAMSWILPIIATIAVAALSYAVLVLSRRVTARESGAMMRESRMRMLQGRLETQEALLHDLSQMQHGAAAVSAMQTSRVREPDLTYREAIYLARQGHIPLSELVGRCGVSPGEAELIMRLHRPPMVDDGLAPFAVGAQFGDTPPANAEELGGERKLQ